MLPKRSKKSELFSFLWKKQIYIRSQKDERLRRKSVKRSRTKKSG